METSTKFFLQRIASRLVNHSIMSGVVGIDIGSADSIVASVGRGMVDIVRNEVSERVTPSVVGFTHRNRLLGEAAISLIKSNYSNTCRFPKLLLGKKISDPDMEDEKFFQLCKLDTAKDGAVGYAVDYMDKERVFSATEITAMLLTKLKDTTLNFTGAAPKDAVIACPSYFTDIQRRALLDAAEIAGIKPLKIMNDTAATALGYGIYRSNEFDEKVPVNVAFVSVGHSHFTCSIASFTKHQLTVLAESTDRTVGGRNLERLLMEHFAGIFQKKTGLNPLESAKSRYKIEEAVAKMKKILSANSEAAINIECLMEEHDLSAVVSRSDLEAMCAPMVPRMMEVIEKTIRLSGVPLEEIAHVEIVGGCSRIPFVQAAISQAFGNKELSRTLNADECVARGCALQAAILSPLFKVREFNVIDSSPHPISVSWVSTGVVEEDTEMAGENATPSSTKGSTKSVVVFARKSPMNVTKVLTFYRNGPFDITAEYADPDMLPAGTSALLGKYHLAVPQSTDNQKVKVRARLSAHGTFSIESANLIEVEEYDEIVKERVPKVKKEEPAPTEGGENAMQTEENEFEEIETVVKKKREKKTEIRITATHTNGLSHEALMAATDAESAMIAVDREARERDNARNDLESYIYDAREKLSGVWAQYIANDAERDSLTSEITAIEDWLYDRFEDGTRVEFADKLVEISGKISVVKNRHDDVIRKQEAEAAAAAAAAAADVAAEKAEATPATQADVPMEESAKVDEMD
jgi:heat shock protein 4